ncbi:caspase family protein [Leptothoe sp. PORK10 BA2]|uniref:caspase family protein n=1 Tax=Leptothoe sp. PORK10 BA2 TaxID=3110254 RepID=UPI002B1F4B6E|nr:caspase family protein [Leptothoe sp. PORK10 BA2]MEA5463366.1 caspase family protein [Leptothoe sp. PORK10 BA2]
MKRRDFLSATGAILGTLGLSQSQLLGWQQALADPSRRKLALLIGINQYPASVLGKNLKPLRGCGTDVELQRHLLVYRFGFDPNNIVTLVDAQATQVGILSALYQLTQTSSANDFVVVHFSGCGGQVMLGDQQIKTWVPVDGHWPTAAEPLSRDVPVSWVKQILARLKTKQIFTVVDAGYSQLEEPLSGGYRSRSRQGMPTVEAMRLPTTLAEEVLADLGKVQAAAEPAFFPGDVLMAARDGQPVIERQWPDFGAGLFTYGLTRYLWAAQLPAQLSATMRGAQEAILPLVPNQTPYWTTQTADEHAVYGEGNDASLDAVVTAVEGRSATLWLGGLPPDVVQYSERFGFSPQADDGAASIVMRSQSGLTGRLQLTDEATWSVGQPLYEVMRVLPRNISLVVALDGNLERIERVDATSALAALSFVEATDDARPADCMLGKFQPAPGDDNDLETKVVPVVKQGYGLFTPTHNLVVGTLAKQDEAVKMAVGRLAPKLKTMLAMKLLRLSENQASSQLAVRLNLLLAGETEKLVLQQETRRASGQASKSRVADAVSRQNRPVEFSKGAQVRYQALNFGDAPVYTVLLGFDARDRMLAFCPPSDGQPYSLESLQAALTLEPGNALNLPVGQNTWVVDDSEGRVETYLVCSSTPLTRCWQELLSMADAVSNQRVTLENNALPLIQALLHDLSRDAHKEEAAPDSYALDTTQWATIGCHYSIV